MRIYRGLSPKQRGVSHIQREETKFCDGNDSDGENVAFVPERIMVEAVEEGYQY